MCQICETRTPEQKAHVQALMDRVSAAVELDDPIDASTKAEIQAAYDAKWMTEREWAWIAIGCDIAQMNVEQAKEDWVPPSLPKIT